jgi:hypothetical protein
LNVCKGNVLTHVCPVPQRLKIRTLYEADFVQALKDWRNPVQVVWIGLSLHHLGTPGKLKVMVDVRRILGEPGVFVVYENTVRTERIETNGTTGGIYRSRIGRPTPMKSGTQ